MKKYNCRMFHRELLNELYRRGDLDRATKETRGLFNHNGFIKTAVARKGGFQATDNFSGDLFFPPYVAGSFLPLSSVFVFLT